MAKKKPRRKKHEPAFLPETIRLPRICEVCAREARGFAFRPPRKPIARRWACSIEHMNILAADPDAILFPAMPRDKREDLHMSGDKRFAWTATELKALEAATASQGRLVSRLVEAHGTDIANWPAVAWDDLTEVGVAAFTERLAHLNSVPL